MRPNTGSGWRNIALIAVITAGCLSAGWLAVRSAAVQLLPGQAALAGIAPDDPDRQLDAAMIAFVLKQGRLGDGEYRTVADAARAAPLDARPFMLAASRHIVTDDGRPTIALLEAARRLDPRNQWTRLYLLDRYIRAGRFQEATVELAVLRRVVGSDAGNPIVAVMARMSMDPATASGVKSALAKDPDLENAVLTQLAAAGASPQVIFDLASPRGLRTAGASDGWGTVLINNLVARQQYGQARMIWRKLYAVPPSAAALPLYDAELKGLPGSAPFNWSLPANENGTTDRSNGGLSINYYGRGASALASQLLILPPGRYELSSVITGDPVANGGPTLSWVVGCDRREQTPLIELVLPNATATSRRLATSFTVPAAQCEAQWLRLIGNLGQFPSTLTATIRNISINRGAMP